MKLRYLLALTPFLLVACGEPQPSDTILEQRFSDKYNYLELKSIDLTKTEQQGDFILYAAEGKFVTTKDLYENLDGITFGDGPEFYKKVQNAGETFDFTSTVVAVGNDKAGWDTDFKKLNSKLPKFSRDASKIDLASPNVLVVNADDFKQKMENIDKLVIANQKDIDTKKEALIKLDNEINSLTEKKDNYWSAIEVDGQIFTSRYELKQYLRKPATDYISSDASPYTRLAKYDKEYFDSKKRELLKKNNNYNSPEYIALKDEREKTMQEYKKEHAAEVERLEKIASEAFKIYDDGYEALNKQITELEKTKRALNSEIYDIESDTKVYVKAKERAIKDGFIKP